MTEPQSISENFPADALWESLDLNLDPASSSWDEYDYADEGHLLDGLIRDASFPVDYGHEGESALSLPLRTLRFGTGDRPILIWARQHGDEPDCSAALMAVLRHLFRNADSRESKLIREKLNILVMPMVNPDGVYLITRRNAQGIDINRDAAAAATAEGAALLKLKDDFQPETCLNLHDMNPRKTNEAGHPVAIAFQACPFAKEQNDNPKRIQAKKICSIMADLAKRYVGDNVARYTADYMPRAFGDNMMRWGISSILIEAGGHDPEQGGDGKVRRLFALCLMRALVALAEGEDIDAGAGDYDSIPFDSGSRLVDTILEGAAATLLPDVAAIGADIAINRVLERNGGEARFAGIIEDLGDLSEVKAHRRIALPSVTCRPAGIAVSSQKSFDAKGPSPRVAQEYYAAGITTIACAVGPFSNQHDREDFLEDLREATPALNLLAFERVAGIAEIRARHAMSEFAGLVAGGITLSSEQVSALPGISADSEFVKGAKSEGFALELFIQGAASPTRTRVHLHLSRVPAEAVSDAKSDLKELQQFLSDFTRNADQISLSVDGFNEPGEQFTAPFGGKEHFEIGGPADIVGYAGGSETTPEIVFMNGVCVLMNGEPTGATGDGRWILAEERRR